MAIRNRLFATLFLIPLLVAGGFGLARAGDYFLSFLGEELGIDITYENNSGFISCFALRFIRLDKPVFTFKDFDVSLECDRAYIEPRFDRFGKGRTIVLRCCLENARLVNIDKKKEELGYLVKFLGGDIHTLIDEINDMRYEDIYTELIIQGDTVEFSFYEAHSADIKLQASGTMEKSGDFSIAMNAFFSPRMTDNLPEEIKALLSRKKDGWHSYSLDIANSKSKPFLKVESDKFKLNFETMEIK